LTYLLLPEVVVAIVPLPLEGEVVLLQLLVELVLRERGPPRPSRPFALSSEELV